MEQTPYQQDMLNREADLRYETARLHNETAQRVFDYHNNPTLAVTATKRENVASLILSGMAACEGERITMEPKSHQLAAKKAVMLADALLAELAKPREQPQ